MKYYALSKPKPDEAYNMYLLFIASKFKKHFIGTYWLPNLDLYAPIFINIPKIYAEKGYFIKLPSYALRNAYKMICIKGCGRCCAKNSGAFMFEHELKALKGINLPEFPAKVIFTIGGPIKIYYLDTFFPDGRCYFYNPEEGFCLLDEDQKPIICLIHYCTFFAERNGKYYIRVATKKIKNKVKLIYKECSYDDIIKVVRRFSRAKVFRRRIS